MMLCYSKTWKIKYFLDPPPKRLKDTNGCNMSTHTSVFLYNQPVTWIFTRSRMSSLSDSDYKIIPSLKIIVVFSCPHLSIYDIFYTLENTRIFNKRATHFKHMRQDTHITTLHPIVIPLVPKLMSRGHG